MATSHSFLASAKSDKLHGNIVFSVMVQHQRRSVLLVHSCVLEHEQTHTKCQGNDRTCTQHTTHIAPQTVTEIAVYGATQMRPALAKVRRMFARDMTPPIDSGQVQQLPRMCSTDTPLNVSVTGLNSAYSNVDTLHKGLELHFNI